MHESGGFVHMAENLNYSADGLLKIFPKYFNAESAASHARNPQMIANRVYSNRMGNGDEASAEGWKFRGRGILQLTGKDNYFWFAASLEMTPEQAVDYLETFEGAAQSACWFWETNKLNDWADKGDIVTLTKRINGDTRPHCHSITLDGHQMQRIVLGNRNEQGSNLIFSTHGIETHQV